MNNKNYLALIFVAAAGVLAPIHASALSVNNFENLDAQHRTDSYDAIVKEAIHEAFKIDQKTGIAVGKYFTTVPPGASETKGYTAFDAELRDVLQDAKAGKADLDKIQIEAIVFDVIQTDVLPMVAQNTPPSAPAAP